MKQFYFTILLLAAVITANSQSDYVKDSQQKMQEFLQKFPSEQLKSTTASANALDSITFENGEVKKMTYNSSGMLLTYKYYKNEGGTVVLYTTETNTYNESGQPLTTVLAGYDAWSQKAIDQSKSEYTYNAQGRPLTEIEWVVGDEAPNALEYDSKTTYTYVDNKTEVLQYEWDNNQWNLDAKQMLFVRWGTGNYPMVDSAYVYAPKEGSSDEWYQFSIMTFAYSGSLITETLAVGYAETGEQRSKVKWEMTYSTNGNLLMETTEIHNPLTMEWELITKSEYEYNSGDQIIREEDFSEDYWTGVFGPNYRMTYEYDADGNLKSQQEYLYSGDAVLNLFYKNDFTFKDLDTKNIMLPTSSFGDYSNIADFYDEEFYAHGAIDEVKHYSYSYSETVQTEEFLETGKYHYSDHNSIETSVEQLNNTSIKVFPNPFSNEINLKLDKLEEYKLKITNSIGQVVYTSDVGAILTSHKVSSLPSGMYILTLIQNDENREIYKLIKE